VQLKYSEGFNPHPYMSVALPLSVGCASICELMDVGVLCNEPPECLREMVNTSLPDGVTVLEIYTPQRKFNEIAWVEINGKLHYDVESASGFAEKLSERFAEKSIVVSKRTKSGLSDLDIAPHLRDIQFAGYGIIIAAQSSSNGFESISSPLAWQPEKMTFIPCKHDIILLSAKISANNPTLKPNDLLSALDGKYIELMPEHSEMMRIDVYDKDFRLFR
jgi:radical SAM-linked protein